MTRSIASTLRFWCAVAVLLTAIALADARIAPAPPADAVTIAPLSIDDTEAVVVRAQDGASLETIERYAAANGYAIARRSALLHAVEVQISPQSLARAVATLSAAPGVAYVEPVYTAFDSTDNPGDPLFSRERPYLNAIHAPEAWDIEQGRPEVLVAVLDSGVDLEHPDLQGRIWTNPAEVADNDLDDDGNGCFDDVHGCAFVDAAGAGCDDALDGKVDDDAGHGTFVAGVIAANANNIGIVGIARNVTILPVKVLDCSGHGDSLALAEGILYAAKAGAHVMNISLGGPTNAIVVRDAVRVATEEHGALIVAASGNSGKLGVFYPARYPQVLAVGAASSTNPDIRATFSTYGPEVDVVAVGQKIIGTVPAETCPTISFLPCIGDNYAAGSGTSFSAPQAAGLAALIVSRRPGITPASIMDLIKSTATPVPPGTKPDWAGAGRINMLEALRPEFRLGAPGVAKN
jgi:subtilisin family serine protease